MTFHLRLKRLAESGSINQRWLCKNGHVPKSPLNASAGISYNKFLAKLASDHRKPNGQYVITPEMGPAFVETLPVGKFHGIGPATSARMHSLGLYTGLDMRSQTLEFMQANFGKAGAYYYWISRGVDDREVRADRIRKSVGAENTFSTDLSEFDAMVAELQPRVRTKKSRNSACRSEAQRMIRISRTGSMRSPVIVVGRFAFKFAQNARGRASNL
jgi:nucleotidyltransferase/DNA polymerase involved in DNA repair